MSLIARLLTLKAKPGKRSDVMRVWQKYVHDFVAEHGDAPSFYYCFDEGDADTILVFHTTHDQDFGKTFQNQPWLGDYQKETSELLAGPPELRTATVQWAKGATVEPVAATS